MESTPVFVQGAIAFTGTGYDQAAPVPDSLTYTVPGTKRAQLIYFRAGNSSAEMVCLELLRDGKCMRLFPVGAKSAMHVSLAVVEDLEPDQTLTFRVMAPAGLSGTMIVDMGLIEI